MTAPRHVVVVGGGAVGAAVAYTAAGRGLQVTLVDRPQRGRATSASAGGLWPLGESLGLGCGVIFHKAQLVQGPAPAAPGPAPLPACFFDFSMRSNALFPALARELRDLSGMDVEYEETSLLFLMYDDGDVAYADSLKGSASCDPGMLERLAPEALAAAEPAITPEVRGAVRVRGDNQVNPYRLADALVAGVQARGGRVLSHTTVTGLRVARGRVTAVEAGSETIPCDVVVNAAGAWAPEVGRMAGLEIPVRPVRGQIVCTEALPPVLHACLSTSDCYLAQKRHGEVIIGSTTEEVGFSPGVTPDAIRDLCAGAVRAVPFLNRAAVKRSWSGVRPGTPDELPILGPVDGLEGYLNACGHFRTGIVTAPLTGAVLTDLLVGEAPAVPLEPFLLSRFAGPPRC